MEEGLKRNIDLKESIAQWARGKLSLKDISDYDDNDFKTISQIGFFFLMQGKNQDALSIFDGLTVLDPQNPYYYRALGILYYRLGDHQKSIKKFSLAISLDQNSPHAYVNRAEVFIAGGQFKKAEKDLKQALQYTSHRDQVLSKKSWSLLKMVLEELK